MELASVIELKNDILNKYYNDTPRSKPGAEYEAQALGTSLEVNSNLKNHLAAGHSRKGKNDYQLELRLQNPNKEDYIFAENFKAKEASGEANIAVIEHLEIPSQITLAQSAINGVGHPNLTMKRRPMHIGVSVSHRDGAPGTLGVFVRTPEGTDAILSNNHVIGLVGDAKPNDSVYQPGRLEQRYLFSDHRIGYFVKSIHLSKIGLNALDAAYAILEENIPHLGNLVPQGFGSPDEGKSIIEVVSFDDAIREGMVVAKLGRTSGYTSAISQEPDNIITLVDVKGLSVSLNREDYWFNGLMEIPGESLNKPFTEPGDSGSLVFIPGALQGVGLHFARAVKKIYSSGRKIPVSYACSLVDILGAFELTLTS